MLISSNNMKYIDLDRGIYTDPETHETFRCEIGGGQISYYFLSILDCESSRPVFLIGLSDYEKMKSFLIENNIEYARIHPFCVELYRASDVRKLCDLYNELLTKIYERTDSTIKIEFE